VFTLVLQFGAKAIPQLARSSGNAVAEFKRRDEIEAELEPSTAKTESTGETGTETADNTR